MESRLKGDWETYAGDLSRRLTRLGEEAFSSILKKGNYEAAYLDATSGHRYQNPDKGPMAKQVNRVSGVPKKAASENLARVLMTNVNIAPENGVNILPGVLPHQNQLPQQRVLRPKYKTPFGYVIRSVNAKHVPKAIVRGI